jgi:hypothetical protein
MRRREFIGLRLSESDSNLTLSEKRFCRQSGDMSCFDRTNIWNCSLSADRREFITLLGTAAIAWPFAARPQPTAKTYHIAFVHSSASIAEITTGRQLAYV